MAPPTEAVEEPIQRQAANVGPRRMLLLDRTVCITSGWTPGIGEGSARRSAALTRTRRGAQSDPES
jgi:hypothetical protein